MVLLLEQESYLSIYKKGDKKILQATDQCTKTLKIQSAKESTAKNIRYNNT